MSSGGSAACCQEKYGEMLALEFGQPAVFGAVHHITVLCYNLQHPDTYTDEALAWMRSALHDIVEKCLSGPEFLKLARGRVGDDFKVKLRCSRARAPGLARWSMTAADVRTGSPEAYVEDIKAWAESILRDLSPD